jgi:hypothetical protein
MRINKFAVLMGFVRVRETQNEIDALEDLARHNDMPPEVLRGQSRRWVGRYSSCSSGPIAMR